MHRVCCYILQLSVLLVSWQANSFLQPVKIAETNSFLPSVSACVLALIGIVLPVGQSRSSALVLRCAAMVLLEPAVWTILRSKSIYSFFFGFSVTSFVQLLHQHIFTQDWRIAL